MKFLQIIVLEWRSLLRSKTLAMLLVASIAWMFVLPRLITSDGTGAGAHELYVHYSLGGVFLLLVLALASSAAGSLAAERTARRLQLTLVRPVRYGFIALGRIVAQVALGAVVLAVAVAILVLQVDASRPCHHVLSPQMPSPQAEAAELYEAYMKSPDTSDEIKKVKKEVVLRMLAQRAVDSYQTISTNSSAHWTFPVAESVDSLDGAAVRFRFTNRYEMRQDVRGVFSLDGESTPVSNVTQAVLLVPLRTRPGSCPEVTELAFRNDGKAPLMLRPRRDVHLLLPADAFLANAVRAYIELVSILALLIAFATLLSSGLGRPVAVFTMFATLIVAAISPSIVEQYPDESEANRIDRMGLAITRVASDVTRPVASLSPLKTLARDECVEPCEVLRIVLIDLLAIPCILSFLTAFILPRKQDET